MARIIVGMLPSRAEAERVAKALEDEGVDRRGIRLADASTRQEYEGRGERSEGGFWSWLFGTGESWNPDVDYYTEGMGRGGTLVSVDADDAQAERARRILEAYGARMESGGRPADAVAAGGADAGDQVVEVIEEQLRVGKRAVTRGGVRIYTRVSEQPVEEEVRLREERVNVDRRPVDRPVTAGADVFRERSIEVDETVEEAVVAKEARIIEEVIISKDVQERSAKVRDTVRRTDVEIDRRGAGEQDFDADFRAHCNETFGREGLSYDQCAAAYRYGASLSHDRQNAPGDWAETEAEARRRWEERNPGTWDRFRSSIRYAWERARGDRRAA